MPVRINSNVAYARATSDFNRVDRDSAVRRTRLASGLAINKASDGGGRLAVSEGMRAEIGGLTQGSRNAENASDLLRTAEGAMKEISAMLIRMRELAIESSTTTLNDDNRQALDAEFSQHKEYIDRIARLTRYNEQSLLSGFDSEIDAAATTALTDSAATGVTHITLAGAEVGTYTFIDDGNDNSVTLGNGVTAQTIALNPVFVDGKVATGTTTVLNFDSLGIKVELAGADVAGMTGSYTDGDLSGKTIEIVEGTGGSFQLGSDARPADRIDYSLPEMTVAKSIINLAQISIGTQDSARLAIGKVDGAIERTAKARGEIGAVQNRLERTISFTANSIERVTASESTVRDADYAWETSILARNEIVSQSSSNIMLQAQIPVTMIMGLLTQ